MRDDLIRATDLPDLGAVQDGSRLAGHLAGNVGVHTIDAVLDYLRGRLALDVSRFGAKGDGETDDRAAIQRAIDEAARQGVDVQLGDRPYLVKDALYVGDGSAAGVSKYGGVRVLGKGQPGYPPQFLAGYPLASSRSTKLVWGGAQGGAIAHVRGPMQGWGFQNIFFDGANSDDWAGVANIGLLVASAMGGDCRNLSFRGFRDGAIYSTTNPSPPGVLNADSLHNRWDNINIGVGWTDGAKAIVLTGQNPAGNNTDYNDFTNVAIALPTIKFPNNTYGVYFQSCDTNTFRNLHFFNGHRDCIAVVFDYTVNPDWPAGCQLYGVDWGGLANPVQNFGNPSVNARPNIIYAVCETNGGFMPAGLRNVVTESGVVGTYDRTGLTGAIGPTPIHYVYRTGLYRLNYNLLVTGGRANGGNLAFVLNWLDGTGSPSHASPSVPNGPGNFATGSVTMRAARFSEVNWQVQAAGIGGTVTTEYALAMALERLL